MHNKKENKLFKEWLGSVPVGIYQEVRGKIIDECGITNYIYLNWSSGRSSIPVLAQKEINSIARKYELIVPFLQIEQN